MANDTFRITFETTPAKPKFHFSNTEIQQLAISMLVLTLAFAIVFMGGIPYAIWSEFPMWFAIAGLAVITAFFGHELAHKFLAQRYGCWAEFRYWQFGLLIALMFSMMGFMFAAPGAVMIRGNISKSQYGKISAAGPAVNLVIAVIFGSFSLYLTGLVGLVCFILGFVNCLIAGFNLLPIPPFDGLKIAKWSVPVYIAMVILGIIIFVSFRFHEVFF